jgi:hypothetical protein
LSFRIVFGYSFEHANAPDPLLCARRERRCCNRPTNKPDEFPPSHS